MGSPRLQEIGSLKKPSWLVKMLRDKKASQEEKERARDDAAYINIKLEEEAGLDLVYDGEARRIEMYEYAVRRIGGFEIAGWVRSWDNKYYRKARCIDRVSYRGPYHLQEFLFVKEHAQRIPKVPVTGPYTIADWSYNEFYRSKEEFVMDLAKEVMRPLFRDLVRHGARYIQIDEPAATTHPHEMRIFAEAIDEAIQGIDANFSLHICYSGDGYRSLASVAPEMKVRQFALEFANRDERGLGVEEGRRPGYNPLKLFREVGAPQAIGLGVVDVHDDFLEPPELIRDRILYAAKILEDPDKLLINPDCGLRTRERPIAFAKLRNMVEGAKKAFKELGLEGSA